MSWTCSAGSASQWADRQRRPAPRAVRTAPNEVTAVRYARLSFLILYIQRREAKSSLKQKSTPSESKLAQLLIQTRPCRIRHPHTHGVAHAECKLLLQPTYYPLARASAAGGNSPAIIWVCSCSCCCCCWRCCPPAAMPPFPARQRP